MSLLQSIFGTRSDRYLKKIWPIVEKVEKKEAFYQAMSSEELRAQAQRLKDTFGQEKNIDAILVDALAILREAAFRTVGLKYYPVQMVGGIVLYKGNIAEMKTGEGKTLVATIPIYLHALSGTPVHVVTVNDYLAKRDCEWMLPLYVFMGLEAGYLQNHMPLDQKQQIYQKDIVYGTNSEFGFDYLRDNMVLQVQQKVQRGHGYCLVDEVDSVLIDEARTPLIISGAAEGDLEKYYQANQVAPLLKPAQKGEDDKWIEGSGDYQLEEKNKHVSLTEQGISSIEKILGIEDIFQGDHVDFLHATQQALKAHHLYKLGVDYIVEDRQVIIVDENTGRKMPGRRYGEGLHQAIEAKEKLPIQRDNQTLATITIQNYFKMYQTLSGMTGTAATEALEFMKIYRMDTISIPTHVPTQRIDKPDLMYKTKSAKYKALVKEVERIHETGAPILIGTTDINTSEEISRILTKAKMKHSVLNAKHHEQEAKIVAQAGNIGAITIATNMAGRGTDIVLGGNPQYEAEEFLAPYVGREVLKEVFLQRYIRDVFAKKREAAVEGLPEEWTNILSDVKILDTLENIQRAFLERHDKVVQAGGLHILGTERHESRRIDNQLRGRAGRQGDNGFSQFYLSLEDNLLRLFGSDRMMPWMEKAGFAEEDVIVSKFLSRMIETSQKKVELRNFEMRKHLLEYDEVLNKQRNIIYGLRNIALEGEKIKEFILDTAEEFLDQVWAEVAVKQDQLSSSERENYIARMHLVFGDGLKLSASDTSFQNWKQEEVLEAMRIKIEEAYDAKKEEIGEAHFDQMQRYVLLHSIDTKWRAHLYEVDELRAGIGLRSYGEKNPLIEYQFAATDLFEQMLFHLNEDLLRILFHMKIQEKPAPSRKVSRDIPPVPGTTSALSRGKKVPRNAPCPCGSGKKYKNCHGSGI